MQIHELDTYTGDLDNGAYTIIDNGEDTGKIPVPELLNDVEETISELDSTLNGRIDNIIAGGDAPSVAEVTDARFGANGNTYASLGTAIRDQIDNQKDNLSQTLEGIQNFSVDNDFVRGGLLSGNLTGATNRISSADIMTIDRDIVVSVATGFRFGIHYFVNGVFSSDTGLNTVDRIVRAGSTFKVSIARVTEITETANPAEFVKQVTYKSAPGVKLDWLEGNAAVTYNKLTLLDFSSVESGTYNALIGVVLAPAAAQSRCRTAIFDNYLNDVFDANVESGYQMNILYADENGIMLGQTGFFTGRLSAKFMGSKFAILVANSANTACVPSDFTGAFSMMYSRKDERIITADTPIRSVTSMYNGIKFNDDINNNVLATLNDSGYSVHDGTVLLYNSRLYCIYTRYTGTGDSANNNNAAVMMKVFDLDGNLLITKSIAKNGDVHDSYNQNGGAGSPNAYRVGNTIYILYTAKINSTFVEMCCQYSISTDTLSNYAPVLVDGDELNNAWINANTNWKVNNTNYTNAQANSKIATDGTYYYIGWCYGTGAFSGAYIFRTTDFANWELFYHYDSVDPKPIYEMPLVYKNGYVYFAVRPMSNYGYKYGLLGKVSTTNGLLYDYAKFLNASSRPDFFEYSGAIYLVTNPSDRNHLAMIEVSETLLSDSLDALICVGGYNYPSFATDENNGRVYVLRSNNGMELTYWSFLMESETNVQTIVGTLLFG